MVFRNVLFDYSLLAVIAIMLGFASIANESEATERESKNRLSATQEDDGVTILIDGKIFTRYLTKSGNRPVLWPIYGPSGKEITRSYPVGERREGEHKDHIHHRSMWIGYEGVQGIDFWLEPESGGKRHFQLGEIKHQNFSTISTKDNIVTFVTENDWLGKNGLAVCSDTRTLMFGCDEKQRWIDCKMELTSHSDFLKISDSKEGFFALRVASTMRADSVPGGSIITSNGKRNAKAYSDKAAWLDYYGPVDGEIVGIAILCHPGSFNPVPRWFVREYGLLAANPFGELAYTAPKSNINKRPLRLRLAKGQSISMRFRTIFHFGDEMQSDVAGLFKAYSFLPY